MKVACRYTGPWTENSGYAEANRNAIMALHTAGVDVTTEKIIYSKNEADYGESFALAARLENNPIKYDIKIIHTPPDGYMRFIEPMKYHIGHLFWETNGLSKEWVWNCNRLDEIWTGGEVHKETFQRAGVKVPIHVFPQAINTELDSLKSFNFPAKSGFVFYSIFQWIERKNPRALLQAYWDEFQGVEDVTLLLKTYRFGFGPEEQLEIKREIQKWKRDVGHRWFPNVQLCFDLMSSKDMMRLHQTGDCYVSAHRGEGWGVPQAEAAVAGNPIISTNLGGIHEWFEDGKTALLTKWKPVNVFNMNFAPWYEDNQTWAEVEQGDLRGKMRWVYENRAKAKDIGLAAQRMAKEKLSYKVVGESMRMRLETIQKELNG